MKAWLRFAATASGGFCLAIPVVAALAQDAGMRPVAVTVSPVVNFRLGSSETRFGELEFVGGLEIRSKEPEFGQLSALRFLTPGGEFAGVADHGYWFFGGIERDDAGVPVGIADFRMQAMVGADGEVIEAKIDKDAEALDISDGIATVAFERNARVSQYALDPQNMGPPIRDLDFVIPRGELRHNQGIETLLRAHAHGIHAGALIVVAERSIDRNGDLYAAILDGPEKGVFKVMRSDGYDVTDGAMIEETGDLLLLERRFSATHGIGMRIRRINSEAVRRGELVNGPALIEANLGHRIDNMEALDVWRRDDGALMVSILSDDNQSFLQRTIYLEFRLVD